MHNTRLGRTVAITVACTVLLAVTSVEAGTGYNGTGFNGTGFNGTGFNGTGFNGTGFNGTGFNGTGFNGTGFNGAGLALVENTLPFGNKAVFADWTGGAFTIARLTTPGTPLFQIWSDPFSIQLLSSFWGNVHRAGDNLVFCPAEAGSTPVGTACKSAANTTYYFYGNFGMCDYRPSCTAGSCGWAVDQNLVATTNPDYRCQHWASALIFVGNNNFAIHNLFSAAGPSSASGAGQVGTQLTAASPATASFPFKYATEDFVESVSTPCTTATGTTGPVNCSWQTAFDGVCTPFDNLRVTMVGNTSTVNVIAMATQGVHAGNYPFAALGGGASDLNYLGSGGLGSLSANPTFTFQCPVSGTFNLQWAFYDRNDPQASSFPPNTYFTVAQDGPSALAPPMYPADEVFLFRRPSGREGTFAGSMFTNINPALYQCEVRVGSAAQVCGSTTPITGANLCNASTNAPTTCCTPCERGTINFATFPDGSQVPASDVSTANFSSGSVVGGPNPEYWSSRGVSFNGTGLLLEFPSGNTTGDDNWCGPTDTPTSGYACSANNIAIENSPRGNDDIGSDSVPTLDTLHISFATPQPSVALDLDNGYLCFSPVTTVVISNGLDTATVTLCASTAACDAIHPIRPVAFCPGHDSGSPDLCGRFIISPPPDSFQGITDIHVLPTTCSGTAASCTIPLDTTGHAGACETANSTAPNCGANYDPNCGGSLVDNLSFGDFGPGSGTVLFPDGHAWFDGSFATNAYAKLRSCSPDDSLCFYSYEGPMDSGQACTSLGAMPFSLDYATAPAPLTYSGSARALDDVGGCFYNNNGFGTPVAATFNDGATSVPAYGVTSFFANYGAGLDAPGARACPVSTAAPVAMGTVSPTVAACANDLVTLDASGSSSTPSTGNPLTYIWSEQLNRVPPSVSTSPTYSFNAPDPGGVAETLAFTLTVADACNLGNVQQPVNVTIKKDDQPPKAVAQVLIGCGEQSTGAVAHGSPVTLDGTKSSDPDGDPITFSWVQTGGLPVALSNPNAAQPTFTAPNADSTLTFALTVTDMPGMLECGGPLASAAATATVIVENTSHPPIVGAGSAQTVAELTPVALSGTACDPDGDPLSFSWTQIGGPSVALSGATTLHPTFTAPQLSQPTATLTFRLTATDTTSHVSASATVDVHVYDPYQPPDCSHATASRSTLSPPDHKMVGLKIQNVKDNAPSGTGLSIIITGIRQNEPTHGLGSGDACPDASFNGTTPINAFQLREERAGTGSGRVYQIQFTAADGFGGSCSGRTTVCVPYDISQSATCPTNPSFSYDSTVCQ